LNNKIYSANYYRDSVAVIDGATDSLITRIWVGDYPNALIYNPTNNKVYCANRSGDNVTVIDGISDSVIVTVPVGDYPVALTYNPQWNRIYVANYNGSTVSVIRDAFPGITENRGLSTFSKLKIYPNPAKSVLYIHGPWSNEKPTDVKIFDVSGRKAKELKITSPETAISLKGINPGVYFIQFETETKIKKLVVTK